MTKIHYPNPETKDTVTFCGKPAYMENSTFMSMDVTCIKCNNALYKMGAAYNEELK